MAALLGGNRGGNSISFSNLKKMHFQSSCADHLGLPLFVHGLRALPQSTVVGLKCVRFWLQNVEEIELDSSDKQLLHSILSGSRTVMAPVILPEALSIRLHYCSEERRCSGSWGY